VPHHYVWLYAIDRFPTGRVAEFPAAGVPKHNGARSWHSDGTEASARSSKHKGRCQLGAKGTADAAIEAGFQDCSKSARGRRPADRSYMLLIWCFLPGARNFTRIRGSSQAEGQASAERYEIDA
jgi:hypothetical protein